MRRTATRSTDDRAVADTLGFVLMFAMLITAVGLVSTVGVDQLTTLRNEEQVNSADRAMQGLASTFDDVYRRGDPHRSTKIAVSGGHLLYDTESTLTVRTAGESGLDVDIPVHALQHRINGVTITYESGAVFRNGLIRWTPAMTCSAPGHTPDVALVNVLVLTSTGTFTGASGGNRLRVPVSGSVPHEGEVGAVSNEGSTRLGAAYRGTETVYARNTGSDTPVTLDVGHTVDPNAWGRYLADSGWQPVSGADDEYRCEANHVYVRTVTVELDTNVQD
ncbi:MAG: hypothetical protein ABEI96_10815 [Haloarculaceae archaeon]